ncbi:hypothetical protein TNCV_1798831 [Trichonephila clavipes]|uniref:Uncharacterized protein n=1 Tax=Trichonephila clavipes TaxID=2585209 RepID=A0A8X6SFR7_TRICX|nr:hypothetical protein TNCV_1798831 [Trichonephila clavipes]
MPDRTAGRCASHVRWSSALESGFITEDDTSPVCHNCPRSAKIQSTLPMMWGHLSGRRLLKILLMVSLDGTGCLEGGMAFRC